MVLHPPRDRFLVAIAEEPVASLRVPDQRVAVNGHLVLHCPLDEAIGTLELPLVFFGMDPIGLHAVFRRDGVEMFRRDLQFLFGVPRGHVPRHAHAERALERVFDNAIDFNFDCRRGFR